MGGDSRCSLGLFGRFRGWPQCPGPERDSLGMEGVARILTRARVAVFSPRLAGKMAIPGRFPPVRTGQMSRLSKSGPSAPLPHGAVFRDLWLYY